jgi:hypothetical protein
MMVRSGGFWVRFWTAGHSLKLKAGGKKRAQGRPGRASAERAWRNTSCKHIDSLTLIEFNDFISARSGLVRNPG